MDEIRDDLRLTTMQDRLTYLFETVRPVGKARHSVRDVSDAIRADQGFEISAAYIHHICTGKRDNPGVQQVLALAKFFGVPANFLFGDGDLSPITQQLEQLRVAIAAREMLLQETGEALSDPNVRIVALKARGLSTSHLGLVSAVLDQVRQLEGLEPEDESH